MPSTPYLQESMMKIINEKGRIETPEEHQVNMMKLIQKAQNQTKTDQFKFETRVDEYSEIFYSEYCNVKLSSDQINDIRLRWNDINKTSHIQKEIVDHYPNEPEGWWTKRDMADATKTLYAWTGVVYDEATVCTQCFNNFWEIIERLDFYLLENMNDGTLIGTRQAKSGFKDPKVIDEDVLIFIDEKNISGENCDLCGEEYEDEDGNQDDEHVPCATIKINPIISDNLPEQLRVQKYLSTDNSQIHLAGVKKIIALQKKSKKEKLEENDYVLIEKNLKRNEDGDIVPLKSTRLSSHVASYFQLLDEQFLKNFKHEPVKKLEEYVKDPLKYSEPIKIFSNGFGMDSITELVLNHAFWDQIVFSDTGSEQKETYEYIKKFVAKMPKVTRHKIRVVHSRYGIIYNYYNNRYEPRTPSFTKRDCTEKFKIEPIKQWIKGKYSINPMTMARFLQKDANGNKIPNKDYKPNDRESKKYLYHHQVELGLGINYDETKRKHDGNVWYIKNVFPLIEKKVTKKQDEPAIIKALGHELPIKSGCFFCFFANKNYWLKLRRLHPDQYALAMKFYDDAKETSTKSGMRMEMVKFPTEEEFQTYMKKYPTCGDGQVETGCECMTGNMKSDQTRGREFLEEQEDVTSKPAYGGGF